MDQLNGFRNEMNSVGLTILRQQNAGRVNGGDIAGLRILEVYPQVLVDLDGEVGRRLSIHRSNERCYRESVGVLHVCRVL